MENEKQMNVRDENRLNVFIFVVFVGGIIKGTRFKLSIKKGEQPFCSPFFMLIC